MATDLAAAIRLALDQLRLTRERYQRDEVDYCQPWLVLMTTGTTNSDSYLDLAAEVLALEAAKKLSVFPIGIGEGADRTVLCHFSNKRSPMKLDGLRFSPLFQWLAESISKVLHSTPGSSVPLPNVGVWANSTG